MSLDRPRSGRRSNRSPISPTLPTVVATISTKVANPMTNAADVGRLIEQDPALTSKVLRLVNSAYYGFKQIKSIQHAVVILGFNKVKAIIITATVFDIIEQKDGRQLTSSGSGQHSLGVAIVSKAVAEPSAPRIRGRTRSSAGCCTTSGRSFSTSSSAISTAPFSSTPATRTCFSDAEKN